MTDQRARALPWANQRGWSVLLAGPPSLDPSLPKPQQRIQELLQIASCHDRVFQGADALDLGHQSIAGFEKPGRHPRLPDPMGCAGGDDVARLEGKQAAEVRDQRWDVKD